MHLILTLLIASAPGPLDSTDSAPFRRAQRLVDTGRYNEAISALERMISAHPSAREVPSAQYLLGRSLIEVRRYPEAARLFDQLSRSYPALAQDHLYYKGQALYRWGSYLDAAKALSQVHLNGPHGMDAARLRAQAMLQATDFSGLVQWLRASPKLVKDDRIALAMARAKARVGDVLGAYRALEKLWRGSREKAVVPAALLEMSKLKIGQKPMMSAQNRAAVRAVAGSLLREKTLDRALQRLERRAAVPLRAEVVFARGRLARRTSVALKHFARVRAIAPASMKALRADAALSQGRLLQRWGRSREALKIYQEVAEQLFDQPAAQEARLRASKLLMALRKYAEAAAQCRALLLDNPVSPFRKDCLWTMGWSAFRQDEYAKARPFFLALTKMELPLDKRMASRYWLARSEEFLQLPTASDRYRELLRRYPLSYYAALSEVRLTERPTEIWLGESKPGRLSAGALPPALVQIQQYVRLGQRAQARAALVRFEREHGLEGSAQSLRALAQLYTATRQWLKARKAREAAAKRSTKALGDSDVIEAARRSHPLKFEPLVRAAAARFEIPASLLFGLIRTESGFEPKAVSAMNAYGLAQLILPTARRVARKIRAGRVSRWRLLNRPQLNINLGAAYLRELLDQYEGSEVLALAAYNAGPRAVDAWARRRVRKLSAVGGRGMGLMPAPDELAEEIQVEETKRFVKVVLARARGYARLYAKREAPLAGASADPTDPTAYAEPEEPPKQPMRGTLRLPGLRAKTSFGAPLLEALYEGERL